MQKIIKREEPKDLYLWRRKNPHGRYCEINSTIRQGIRSACITEQYGLCAFCCAPISDNTCHNAHLLSQDIYPQHSLNWNNIVTSCNQKETCGKHQGTQKIPVTPRMDECETEFIFYQSGRIKGLTQRANDTIRILHLDSERLNNRRKRAIEYFLYNNEYFPPAEDVQAWDVEILEALIQDCLHVKEGKLAPYSPILVNICRHMLQSKK